MLLNVKKRIRLANKLVSLLLLIVIIPLTSKGQDTITIKDTVKFSFDVPEITCSLKKQQTSTKPTLKFNFSINNGANYTYKVLLNKDQIQAGPEEQSSIVKPRGSIPGHPIDTTIAVNTVRLKEGDNIIKIIIKNKYNVAASHSYVINYNTGKDLPDLYIISAGVNDYTNLATLDYAEKDANAITELIKKQKDSLFNDVYSYLLLGKQFTKDTLATLFDKTLKNKAGNTVLVFMTAGHGIKSKNSNAIHIPFHDYDSNIAKTFITKKELNNLIKKLGYASLLIYDTCNSGDGRGKRAAKSEDEVIIEAVKDSQGKQLSISAAIGDAYENSISEHGNLTTAILEIGRNKVFKGLAIENDVKSLLIEAWKDDKVSVGEIIAYVSKRVKNIANIQNKDQKVKIIDKDKSNFYLFKKPNL